MHRGQQGQQGTPGRAVATETESVERHRSRLFAVSSLIPALPLAQVGTMGFIEGVHPGLLWVIGGVVGLILEMLVPAFVIGSFGLSALFAGLAAWLGASSPIQIAIFGVLGFVFVVPARRFIHRRGVRTRHGGETLPGKLAVCLEPIDGDLQAGIVELDGARWTAITIRGAQIPRGATVEVVAVEGVRLLVAEHKATTPAPH